MGNNTTDTKKDESTSESVVLRLSFDRVAQVLVGLTLAWPLLDILTNVILDPPRPIERMFNVAREDSIPSFYSAMILLFVGILFLLYSKTIKQNSGYRRRTFALGGLFLYMGFDDAVEFHERFSSAFKYWGSQLSDAGYAFMANFPTFFWQLLFLPIFGGMALLILYMVWKDFERPILRVLFLGTLVCFVSAVGLDVIEGMIKHSSDAVPAFMHEGLFQHLLRVVEESIEMLGATFAAIVGLLLLKQTRIAIESSGTDEPLADK